MGKNDFIINEIDKHRKTSFLNDKIKIKIKLKSLN